MRHLKLFVLLLMLPFLSGAQVDLSYFPHYNADLMEDLGVSAAQLQAIQTLDEDSGARKSDLYDALLYQADLNAALKTVEEDRIAALQSILTEAQKQAYQQFNADVEAEQRLTDLGRYRAMYLDTYRYLKLKDAQAQELAELELDVRDGKRKGASYADLKTDLLQEILSPKQWKKYSKKRKKERFETKTTLQEGANMTAMLEQQRKEMKFLEEVYVPQRNALRQKLEEKLSAQDQQVLAQLRAIYQEDDKAHEVRTAFYQQHIIDQDYKVRSVVHSDRPTFERAKALGIKLDKAIDALQPQLHELQEARYGGTEGLFMRGLPTSTDKYTEKVELVRNIAFLLIEPETTTTKTVSNAHQLRVYPLPATTTQTLQFEVQQSGELRIDLLDAQGKLLKVLFQETLTSGTHQREVELSQTTAGAFFYRIESADGVSLFKSLKVQ